MKCFYLFLILLLSGCPGGAAQEMIFQKKEYEQILAKAKQEGKPVFIDFYATWCGPCKQMEKIVFVDPDVRVYYDKHFLSIQVDVDNAPKLARKYKVQSVPTLIFLNSHGKELKRVTSLISKERFLHIGQEITGERPSYPELYKRYNDGEKDLSLMQTLLLEAPDYVNEVGESERIKWRMRASKIFQNYVSLKGLDQMINSDDFQVILLFQEKSGRNDPVLNFVNEHHKEFEKVIEPHVVWEFIISQQNGLIHSLARKGDLSYLEELERITGDMRDVYARIKHSKLSVYAAMKNQADGIYALYAEKDESKYLDLKEAYFKQIGELLSFGDYQEAIQELVMARNGILKPKSYERCLIWLDRASKLNLQPSEQLDLSCLMGNCFRGLENVEKARACFNQAYVLAMQLNDVRMQVQIKTVLEQLSE